MENAPSARGNIALLIDADNASPNSIDPVLTVLAELGTVNIRRVYGNWRKQSLKGWADMTLRYGIEPYQQFDITKGKNATDMRMTIDAMDLLFGGRVTGFGILSSDSDFMPLAMRIRQQGLDCYGFGTDRTPEGFRQACSRFIDVQALVKAHDDNAASASATTAAEPSEPASGGKQAVDEQLLRLLIDAYNAAKRDERGYASLSDVGQRAGNRSSFDTRNYGFARLSDLIEAVPNFQTERREGGQIVVKRVR
ncbi:NYN domain-containing protein [Stakelama sp. CBK3Z-3]|uniref:NYN domain-containing protein n=1 Tax=Stakelama flava TaxID=2860338 RepID=A0ABS6XKY6_9SPHN|nr:NYN domain-containing protein [Stakelama flava]MBW4330869.1 NYN domain-containing protein [Stakelama flava]